MIKAAGELDCFSAHICLREPGKLVDKADSVEAGGRKGRGSDDESSGDQLPKSKASIRKEVDSKEHHSVAEADLPITKERMQMQGNNSRAMGLAAPWYHRGGTSVESSIPCSHGGRALVIKGAEEVENAKTYSKYQDKVEGQRPRNFIRSVSMNFSSREPKVMDFELMQECSTKERSRQCAVLLFFSEE
ncbi:hypothetical protein BHE74_00043387 [Ensete ventricosum]|nr:hypothetical protein GW17_00015148 [Ensete ventricosum]RWW50368.1 hypothetical protein BHE74_00043387 [Ensete ventricosum]